MKASLRTQLFSAFLFIVLINIGLIGYWANRSTTTEFNTYVRHSGMYVNTEVVHVLTDYYQRFKSWEGVEKTLAELSEKNQAYLALSDVQGRVIADAGQKTDVSSQTCPVGQRARSFMITSGNENAGIVLIQPSRAGSFRAQPEEVFLTSISRSLWLAAVIAIGLSLFLSYLLSIYISTPVRSLISATKKVSSGEFSHRVSVKGSDEMVELGRAFNQLSENLEQNERLRQQLVADVAHELRTPLATIQGYLEAMREGVIKPTPDKLGLVHEETALLARLIDDLRDLSQAEAGQLNIRKKPTDLSRLIKGAISIFQSLLEEKKIGLISQVSTKLPRVNVDKDRISQILRNLISNAINHTPAGGKITISAVQRPEEIEIRVSDTGQGIKAEDIPYVFERFYRGEKSRARASGGAGIGLTIAKRLIETHGGKIWVESAPGQGTEVYFTLPL